MIAIQHGVGLMAGGGAVTVQCQLYWSVVQRVPQRARTLLRQRLLARRKQTCKQTCQRYNMLRGPIHNGPTEKFSLIDINTCVLYPVPAAGTWSGGLPVPAAGTKYQFPNLPISPVIYYFISPTRLRASSPVCFNKFMTLPHSHKHTAYSSSAFKTQRIYCHNGIILEYACM